MGRAGGGAAAQKPGGEKKSLFKRLFTKGIRQRSAGRLVVDGEGSPSRSSDATPSAPATPHGAPGTFVTPPSSPNAAAAAANGPAGSGASPASPNAAAAAANGPASSGAPPASVAGAAAASPAGAASGSGPRCLMVQVIAARKLRAADSNGLSDPYCLVKVGTNQASTKTELKTLEPRWNETMAFGPTDVEEAEAESRPYVALRVFDWDLVSADDFLGQAELPFADVDPSESDRGEPRWLPLYGWKGSGKGAKKVDAGDICVQAWFEAGGGERPGGSALSTLCCQPGTRKQVPLVVHSSQGSLYEEPLMVCLAVTLERIEGMHVPLAAQAASASRGAEAEAGFSPAFSRTSAISRNSFSPGGAAGKKPALGGLLGRVLPGRSRSSNGRRLDRSTSLRSATSDDMLAGEDPGDEYGGGLPFGYQEDTGPMFEDDLDDPSRLSRMSPTGAGLERPSPPPHPLLAARAAAAAAVAAGSPSRLAAVGEDGPLSDAVDDSSLSGMRCYVRLVLGGQKHTSFIKKERLNGTVNLQQTFVFAAPLPLRDRELRVEVYRTASSTQRGRLISIANVWLHDLLPPGLSRNLEAVRRRTVELESVQKNQAGGRAQLRCTLVDTDQRRAIYQTPFLDGDLAEDVGDEDGGSEQGGGQCSEDDPRAMVQRLQSTTEGLSQAELRQKALLTEKSFIAWQGSRPKQLQDMAASLLPAASDLAQQSWRRVSRLFSASEVETNSDSPDAAGDAPAAAATAAPPALPAPAGRLELTVDSVTIAGAAASGDVFLVLKCGPHWGRSKVLQLAGNTAACGWHLSLPVLDPAAVLTLAVFQQSRGGKAKGRPGFLPASAVQVVGKLRVRLSCLWPNTQHSASLPLLGDRAKGAQVVGAVSLSLQACYASTKAMFKGYTAPALPKAAYVHGVDDKGHQGALARESRRIVLRWLDSANPPISGPVALTVLDAEREAFAMSRARLNMRRIQMALVGIRRFKRRFDEIKTWKEPKHSVAAMAGICFFCFLPRLAIPALLAWLVVSTLAAQPENAGLPAPMQQDPAGIEPENESLETGTANPVAALRAKLERLQRVGLTVQNVLDGVACAMERFGALLSWQDPSATLGVCIALSAVAALIFLLGLSTVLAFVLCFVIRPPALRTPTPPLPAVVFGKLPTRNDVTA